jgi:hypothetical protein
LITHIVERSTIRIISQIILLYQLKLIQILKIYQGYSGLQGKPDMVKYWEENNIPFKPYPSYKFGHKKSISNKVENNIMELAKKYGTNVFKKTACSLSYTHGMERNYNAHYYRPNEVNCCDKQQI